MKIVVKRTCGDKGRVSDSKRANDKIGRERADVKFIASELVVSESGTGPDVFQNERESFILKHVWTISLLADNQLRRKRR